MQSNELSHLQRRAAQHRASAKHAAMPEVAAIHMVLAQAYVKALAAENEIRNRDRQWAA